MVRERTNCPSGGTTGGETDKENVREWKILKEPIYMWI
jgi:hypothetical protein